MADGFGQRRAAETLHMPSLSVTADANDRFDQRQLTHQAGAPLRSAFPARRKVRSLRIISREAEPHRNDCKLPPIIKQLASDPQPEAKTVAGGIVEGETRC